MPQSFALAVKGIIKNSEGKYLILFKSNEEDMNPNDFDIPGGRIKRGESLEEALTREIQEETGLGVEIQKISRSRGFIKGDMHLVGITFLCIYKDSEAIQLSNEHNGYRWKTKEEIINGDFPSRLKDEFSKIL